MNKRALLVPVLLLGILIPASPAIASPAGPESNPIGSLRWLPANTNEGTEVPEGLRRLVVIYDRSLTQAGKPAELLAQGGFGVKFTATGSLNMAGWSPRVSPVDNGTTSLEGLHATVRGDVRDGDCSKAGTAAFSAAFSTTRTFLHSGTTPYVAQDGPGACEIVDASNPSAGGFQTRVTTFVPGFWIDLQVPTNPGSPQVWYSAVFDTEGETGPYYQTADSVGFSKSTSTP
jgi:hypothetical protein